jgi:N-carbamoylputrescine amidase
MPARVITALEPPPSPARVHAPSREPFLLGLVQQRWHPDRAEHEAALLDGIRAAAARGASLVGLQELTLSRYLDGAPPEDLERGPTFTFAAAAARQTGVHVMASLYERAGDDGLGYNTAIVVSPDGDLVSRTRKLHIPGTDGYGEDAVFRPAVPGADSFPVVAVGEAKLGFPTCYDQWFPELARAYALAGAELIVYPTAIGSEPAHAGFDSQPMWERVIVAAGIANGTFMAAVNRIGTEGELSFYGSSFVSDPYGRKLVQAPRDEPAVLVAALDLDQRRDWLELFPFFRARRPDAYGSLVQAG